MASETSRGRVTSSGMAWRVAGVLALLALTAAAGLGQLGQLPPASKTLRASALMQQGREAYLRGDYKGADDLYKQAQNQIGELGPQEQKDLDTLVQQNNAAWSGQVTGHEQLKKAKELFDRGGLESQVNSYLNIVAANQFLTPADKQLFEDLRYRLQHGNSVPAGGMLPDAAVASKDFRTLMKDARTALQKKDFDTAEYLAKEADKLNKGAWPTWMHPWDDTPAKVLADVKTGRDAAAQQAKTAAPANAGGAPMPKGPSQVNVAQSNPAADAKADKARQLIKDGYKALNKNDVQQARDLAFQAKSLNASLLPMEDNPDKLLKDIADWQTHTASMNPPVAGAKIDPKELMRQAREQFNKHNLDEADRLCTLAASAPANTWSMFSDQPSSLRKDIQNERAREVLAQGRQLLKQGKYKEAEEKSYLAEKLHGPYAMLELGDRPSLLRADIAVAQKSQPKIEVPPDLARPGMPPTTGGSAYNSKPAMPAMTTEQMLARQKVLEMMNGAVALQNQYKLIEARNVAEQARQAAANARKMGVMFGPGEDPEGFLLQLSVQCQQRIAQLLQQVDKCGGDRSPGAFEKAAACVQEAHALATAFGLPQRDIDAKHIWLGQLQLAQGGPPAMPGSPGASKIGTTLPPPPPEPANAEEKQGRRLIDDAYRELKAGQTLLAEQIALEAMKPTYNVKKQAEEVLRAIQLERVEQNRVAAQRNFLAFKDAIILGRFDDARNMLPLINVAMLSKEEARHFDDIMALPAMQGGSLAQTGAKMPAAPGDVPPSAKISVTDKGFGTPSPIDPANGLAENTKMMESILYDKLKTEGSAVQVKSLEVFKLGDFDRALEMLRSFNQELAETQGLAPDRVKLLKYPIDQRIQKFQEIKAQKELELAAKAQRNIPYEKEQIAINKQQKTDKEISKILKEAGAFFHDHKYDQAEVLANQAHDLDQDNVAVNALLEMIIMARNRDIFWETEHDKEKHIIDGLTPNYKNITDMPKRPVSLDKALFNHGKDRPNKAKVAAKDSRSDIERQIEEKLEHFFSLKISNRPLDEAVEDLKKLSSLNIVLDKAALTDQSVNLKTPVSAEVDNIPLSSALRLMLHDVKLTYVIKDNVLQITTPAGAVGSFKRITYNVIDLVTPPMDPTHKALPGLAEMLNQPMGPAYGGPAPFVNPTALGGANPIGTQGTGAGNFAATPGSTHNVPDLSKGQWNAKTGVKQTIEDQLINLITATIEPQSWSGVGGKGTIQYFPLGGGLIVNQTQDIQEQISDLLDALRRLQDLEVAIEIRLVAVSESFFEFMGLDFDININLHNSKYQPQLIGQQFQPFGFVNKFLPQNFVAGLTPAGTFTPDLNIPLKSSSFDYTLPPAGLGGFPGVLGADGGLSMGLAFLSDIQVFMFFEAAQGDKRANAMQAPRVTVFNGQFATLQVTDSLPFLASIQPMFGSQGELISFVPQQIPLPLGTGLNVQPVVTADRRFVRLSINQTMQNLVATNVPLIPIQIPFQDAFFGPGQVGTQTKLFQIFLQQPATSSITVNTTVTVPDGGTVLLGGLKTLTEQRNEFGPPVLSKIPYLSRLFKNVGYGREATSLLLMVTPRIIINEEEELIYLEQIPPIPRP